MAVNATLLLRHLHDLSPGLVPGEDSDAVLLGRFVRHSKETAVTTLVARHGPMVLAVCRRLLSNSHDAEDVFQATFLTLARNAASIRRPESLPAWLHGVALRLARKARAAAARRRQTQVASLCPPDPRPDPLAEISARELLTALDEEVARLPEADRLPLGLCCL